MAVTSKREREMALLGEDLKKTKEALNAVSFCVMKLSADLGEKISAQAPQLDVTQKVDTGCGRRSGNVHQPQYCVGENRV